MSLPTVIDGVVLADAIVLPCPHCGTTDNDLKAVQNGVRFNVICPCGAVMAADSMQGAIDRWNARVS